MKLIINGTDELRYRHEHFQKLTYDSAEAP